MRTIAGTTWPVDEARKYIEDRVMIVPWSGCWLWEGCIGRTGYGKMGVSAHRMVHVGRFRAAHRLAYEAWREDPVHMSVLHSCDVRACCNPDHLRLGDQFDNMGDAVKRGSLRTRTIRHSRLSIEQVRQIVVMRVSGASLRVIAKAIGVSDTFTESVCHGTRWAWATEDLRAQHADHPFVRYDERTGRDNSDGVPHTADRA